MKNGFQFLVIGAGRGGTSLLAGLLDAHPDITMGFEAFATDYLKGYKIAHSDYAHMLDERIAAFQQACSKEADKHPGKLWGNKITTEQIAGLEDYNSLFPFAKKNIFDAFFNQMATNVIFILRDGRNCVASKVKRTGQAWELAAHRWRYAVRVYEYLQAQHPRTLFVRFEDLVTSPKDELMRIAKFLGINYCDEMLTGTQNHNMLMDYRRPGFDLHTTNINSLNIPSFCFEIMRDDLQTCGYVK
jgi:hypothetical protein